MMVEIDGVKHNVDEGTRECDSCNAVKCKRCMDGLVHSQGVWGGIVFRCDVCDSGANPDYDEGERKDIGKRTDSQ